MSATFLMGENGVWINAAHVVSVDSDAKAQLTNGHTIQLSENWADPGVVFEVVEEEGSVIVSLDTISNQLIKIRKILEGL